MTLSEDQILDIGIKRIDTVQAIATVIEYTRSKEELLHVLGKMQEELKKGIAELDREVI